MIYKKDKPSDQVLQQAKQNPNGWVYQIEGQYAPGKPIPPSAIVGAWKVDSSGNIIGDFIPNPNYNPKKQLNSDRNSQSRN